VKYNSFIKFFFINVKCIDKSSLFDFIYLFWHNIKPKISEIVIFIVELNIEKQIIIQYLNANLDKVLQ
jgi:hypothetical protein